MKFDLASTKIIKLAWLLILLLAPSLEENQFVTLECAPDPSNYQIKPLTTIKEALTFDSCLDQPPRSDRQLVTQKLITTDKSNLGVFNISQTGEFFHGYNLFVVEPTRETTGNLTVYPINKSLIICDMNGEVLVDNPQLRYPFRFFNSTTILATSLDKMVVLWNFINNKTVVLGPTGHHEIEFNPNNETYFTFTRDWEGIEINGSYYLIDKIIEYNFTGHEVWSLDTQTFISHTQWCPYQDKTTDGVFDLTHSNSIFYDPDEDVIYYNSRNVNTFYKIDHKSGQILWGLGEYGNFTLFDKKGYQKENLFYHAHAVEKVDNNTFILFDNDMHNQSDYYHRLSRIIEITINENTMIANESWSWVAPPSYYCNGLGDADRLPNGNRLGVFGTRTHPNSNIGARLVEVNETGKIVWEMNFPINDFAIGIMRMERFRFSPILSAPEDIVSAQGDIVNVTWQSWYNFRTRMRMNGSYKLYLNDQVIEMGNLTFDKFWRCENLTFTLNDLESGKYNLTLAVADEGGHITTDSLNISVESFYLKREGPISIELGQSNSIINWMGWTLNPLQLELWINDSTQIIEEWRGTTITLDLNTLVLGTHYINLILMNDTVKVFNDSFYITVYPTTLPLINTFPSNQNVSWNETIILSWEIFDHSPSNWKIWLNETLAKSDNWNTETFTIHWSVPTMDEGVYNITLFLCDELGQQTLRTTWLIVLPPSPPVVIPRSEQFNFQWGQTNASINWEVHGGTIWTLWKNGVMIRNELITGQKINVKIKQWQAENWYLGLHNLTLQVSDAANELTISTIWIYIWIEFGDIYANTVVSQSSTWYYDGDNAVGAPDGKYSQIYVDYGLGYLTLDMGYNEEIVDEDGVDFSIITRGGPYNVYASNDLDSIFTEYMGWGNSNSSWDLTALGASIIRYIRVECRSDITVELDAILAINYKKLVRDPDPPYISGPADSIVRRDKNTITLTWIVSDATPWNYSILVNGIIMEKGPWNGTTITYILNLKGNGYRLEIVLILHDIFGNCAKDTVKVEIYSITTNPLVITTANSKSKSVPFIIFSQLTAFGVFLYLYKFKTKRM